MKARIIEGGNMVNTGKWDSPQRGRIYSTDGISPALNGLVGGGRGLQVKIMEIVRYDKSKCNH